MSLTSSRSINDKYHIQPHSIIVRAIELVLFGIKKIYDVRNFSFNFKRHFTLRCASYGVLKEVLRLLFFINDTSLDVQNEKIETRKIVKNSELSFLRTSVPGAEEKAPFSSGADFSSCGWKRIWPWTTRRPLVC